MAVTRVSVNRLRRPSDYRRVLAQAPAVVNRYFALHGPVLPHIEDRGRGKPKELSTVAAQACPHSVDKVRSPGRDPGTCEALWLGMVVPKRFARKSVTRSLMKRQMRNGMLSHAARLPAGLWVIRLRAAFDPGRYISAASTGLRVAVKSEIEHLLASIDRVARAPEPNGESP